MHTKANADDLLGRFREIVSDPLNFTIRRDPRAGYVENNHVYLHNGLRVPVSGNLAYYGEFSDILVINRGVHEPLEEFVFQEVIKQIKAAPLMIELGAYWGHYSMWLKRQHPDAKVILVEPELQNLNTGKYNFELNGFTGDFIHEAVGKNKFEIDHYLEAADIPKVTILHSDIQGHEIEMLEGCTRSLADRSIDYLFISTHSQELHQSALAIITDSGYRIEVSSDFEFGTTSYDGFIFSSNPMTEPVFKDFDPIGRNELSEMRPDKLVDYLKSIFYRDL